jgi:chromosome segregation ATPase
LLDKAESELESARLHLLRFDHEISALLQERASLNGLLEKVSLKRVKLQSEFERIEQELESLEKDMKDMKRKNEWIGDSEK